MKLRISYFEQNAKLFLSLPLDLIIDAANSDHVIQRMAKANTQMNGLTSDNLGVY